MDDLRGKIAALSAEEQAELLGELSSFESKLERNSGEMCGMKMRFAKPSMRTDAAKTKSEEPLERSITDKILRWLRQQDKCWCFKVAGSGGQMRGVPDIVGCLDGRFFALEVKRPRTGRVSEIQKHMICLIAGAGGTVGVVYSVEDVQRLLMGGVNHEEV